MGRADNFMLNFTSELQADAKRILGDGIGSCVVATDGYEPLFGFHGSASGRASGELGGLNGDDRLDGNELAGRCSDGKADEAKHAGDDVRNSHDDCCDDYQKPCVPLRTIKSFTFV
jgi:hypothetical protein